VRHRRAGALDGRHDLALRRYAPVLAAVLAACSQQPALHGTPLNPPQPAKSFTLIDQNGAQFSLAAQRGRAVALYFGFTHCRDVCPQTLAKLAKARERDGLTNAQLAIVMITVDRRHDSRAALRAFIRKIGASAIGLTGSETTLRHVYRDYGIEVKPESGDVLHTDTIFLIDSGGRLRELLDPGTPLEDIAADLRAVVG
jgi:protein SCO1/2